MDNELYPHSDITEKIISAVYEVYNRLGAGFIESVYEKALAIALRKRGLKVETQKLYRIMFDNQIIGKKEEKQLLELKDSLNPDSHILTTNNIEDVRNFARKMMEFLYSIQFKQSEVIV